MCQLRSHSLSTGCNRRPDGQYIDSSISVPIVLHTASWTSPPADGDRQTLHHVRATGAGLARRKPPIHLYERLSVPFAFVAQHPDERTPSRIRDGGGNVVVSHHVLTANDSQQMMS